MRRLTALRRWNRLLESGRKLLSDGRTGPARQKFARAVSLANEVELGLRFEGCAHHHLGQAWRARGDLNAAKRHLATAVQLLAAYDGIPLVLGCAMADLGEVYAALWLFEEAEKVLLRLLDRFPHDQGEYGYLRARAMRILASVHARRNDFEPAKTFLSEAMAANIRLFGPGHHTVRETMDELRSVVAAMYDQKDNSCTRLSRKKLRRPSPAMEWSKAS